VVVACSVGSQVGVEPALPRRDANAAALCISVAPLEAAAAKADDEEGWRDRKHKHG
jgi:hypothetical protein